MSSDYALEIQATMSGEAYSDLPEHVKEVMKIKTIERPSAREHYKKDEQWQELHKQVIESVKARNARQDEIRVELKFK